MSNFENSLNEKLRKTNESFHVNCTLSRCHSNYVLAHGTGERWISRFFTSPSIWAIEWQSKKTKERRKRAARCRENICLFEMLELKLIENLNEISQSNFSYTFLNHRQLRQKNTLSDKTILNHAQNVLFNIWLPENVRFENKERFFHSIFVWVIIKFPLKSQRNRAAWFIAVWAVTVGNVMTKRWHCSIQFLNIGIKFQLSVLITNARTFRNQKPLLAC